MFANLGHCFAKSGENLARNLEPEHVLLCLGNTWLRGQTATPMTSDAPFDLAHGAAARDFEPSLLGLVRRDARKLAHA